MTASDILALSADELESEIRRHDVLYHVMATPEIDDTLYDLMVERLRQLRPGSALLRRVGAGGDEAAVADADGAAPGLAKVVHERPMLSLEKCYDEAELLKWFDRFDGPALATHKVDGVAISIRYGADGAIALGATRGTGEVGELITDNVRRLGAVPRQLERGGIEVRGEAYIPVSVFRDRFAEQFANPRNLCAGALKQKDADRTASYGVRFFAYDALGLDELTTESEKRAYLASVGFEPVPGRLCTAADAQTAFEALAAHREQNDFETDGIVFKVDDCAQHEALGSTAHHPRWAIAYKYQGESGFSTFAAVEWSVSRSGAINPVGVVAPVFLSGVTVTRVSLHNLAIIERLAGAPLTVGENPGYALSAGARVLMTRRGGVIPHIESVAEPGVGAFRVPEACPSCGATTERRGDLLVADHTAGCASRGVRALEHFVSVAEINGFGPKILDQLVSRGFVTRPADLFTLTVETLEDLDRLGRRSAEALVEAVASRRRMPLATFLAALGIPDLGGQMARVVGGALGTLGAVRAATVERLQEIHGVGPAVATSIVDGLARLTDDIDALLAHVEVVEDDSPEVAADGPQSGKSFVFTGALDSMGRREAQALVEAAGGVCRDSVSAALDFLVLGDKDHARWAAGWRSSKLTAADKLVARGAPLKIISESEFLSMMGVDRG